MSLLWDNSLGVFLLLAIFLGGGAAWLSGRAIALTWRPVWQILVYMVLLSGAVRFLNYGLFEGTLLSLYYYIVSLLILLAFAGIGFWTTRVRQMVNQYPWLYERSGPFAWKRRMDSPENV